MRAFTFASARTVEDALDALADGGPGPKRFIAGGTNLIDLMKEDVARPAALVDINRVGLDEIRPTEAGGLLLGALARNAATARHPEVRRRYPLVSAAILAGASPQIRNMATNGGNLLQRTRCHYFYDVGTPCNKREPGEGCSAIEGLARQHAILGASEHCIATHPSDLCVALAALGAVVHVRSAAGQRLIPFEQFHRLPGDEPQRDTTLGEDELITAIELPPSDGYAAHSTYLKVRERASYAFALVSVAAALDLDEDGAVRGARLALGGVAHKPWRVPEAEEALVGARPTPAAFEAAAETALAGAQSRGDNAFKIPLAHRAVVRALGMALDGVPANTGLLGLPFFAGEPFEGTPLDRMDTEEQP
ncbi:FAD binding domain-containing protein [Actinocorallia populi]|uniref:FAD binding domain-containing protein n=1 Tax=Actinocorallia populi TaxID=2079200 RepID=UPI000D0936A5|nr:xanthine dehydrogenase family protein subunit M [Actinocorallia populi]